MVDSSSPFPEEKVGHGAICSNALESLRQLLLPPPLTSSATSSPITTNKLRVAIEVGEDKSDAPDRD